MAIPVHLQQFKAAGIYRVVFDKSTVLGVDSEILRLVVGYSEVGPFNIPTYVTSPSDFKAIYGDISKKLEKRGVYFHRLAMQALTQGPILALNLKKFDGETVGGASINTDFNPSFAPIDTVELNVEDIYDTSRFWELSAEKLNNLRSASGEVMDQYINICTTNTAKTSATYFIRKASGTKLNGYNLSVSDWYSDKVEEMPEYLEPYKNSMISDFFAEIYVFKGKFTASQVLASTSLKKYFEPIFDESTSKPSVDENGEVKLKLRSHLTNAFGDYVDTLDALYADETSGALSHYIGSLIPYFKNKQGAYASLDVLFNSDQDLHNMMMSFNVDLLEELETAHIDLSGRLSIPTDEYVLQKGGNGISLELLYKGEAVTTLLGNEAAPVITDVPSFTNNIVTIDDKGSLVAKIPLNNGTRRIMGSLYVKDLNEESGIITLQQVGSDKTVKIITEDVSESKQDFWKTAVALGAAVSSDKKSFETLNDKLDAGEKIVEVEVSASVKEYYRPLGNGYGTVWNSGSMPFIDENGSFVIEGPAKIITSITRIEEVENTDNYSDADKNMKVNFEEVVCMEKSNISKDSIYGSSVTFFPVSENWKEEIIDGSFALVSDQIYDTTLFSAIQKGDCFLADDGSTDMDGDGENDLPDNFYDNVYVQETGTITNELGDIVKYYIKLTGKPYTFTPVNNETESYYVRIDAPINQEIGTITPQYLKGYTYKNSKPAGTSMKNKLDWQKFMLSALTEYKGLRTGLLNKSDIDYRYIVDTFESYVDEEVKSVLCYLAKEKQSAFAILNFPSVKTFIKCPYTSFTDSKGIFNVQYIVNGYNKKKPAGIRFSLPSDANGASFCAFYTPLKFTDGYVDSNIPSAGLVSNLFMEKYMSRQPYYIIAGPNYGRITASGLVGPDYKYSPEELNIIEPFGVNCMIYRPGFGTFINANQTAKQTPVSALSKVNVRELVIYLQDEIEKVLQSYQWEFNNATTRNAILDKANAICSRIANNGGIQAFLNIMDESNNTPEIIDNEMAVLSTHIEPGMGCGKMVHELTLYRTGQMTSSISD